MSQTKTCAACKNIKSLSDFPVDLSRADGHYVYCKECVKARSKTRRFKAVSELRSMTPERFDTLPGEIFKDLPGYEGEYQVSDMGRIKSLKTKRGLILKPKKNKFGYMTIVLSKDHTPKTHSIHSLVLIAFVSDRPEGLVVNHIDGNKANNTLGNLEWVTQQENTIHSYRVLKHIPHKPPLRYGEEHHFAKLSQEKVAEIRELYATGEYPSRRLAAMYGVSKVNILNIVNNKIWRNI